MSRLTPGCQWCQTFEFSGCLKVDRLRCGWLLIKSRQNCCLVCLKQSQYDILVRNYLGRCKNVWIRFTSDFIRGNLKWQCVVHCSLKCDKNAPFFCGQIRDKVDALLCPHFRQTFMQYAWSAFVCASFRAWRGVLLEFVITCHEVSSKHLILLHHLSETSNVTSFSCILYTVNGCSTLLCLIRKIGPLKTRQLLGYI